MATLVNSLATQGVDGYLVEIETSILEGQPALSIIGLGDQAVREAGDRIQSALYSCGYDFPKRRVIVNLAPSSRKKFGSHFDLAMAISVLQESSAIGAKDLQGCAIIGELALDGALRSCNGALPMVMYAKSIGIKRVILPYGNIAEASHVKGVDVLGFATLQEVVGCLEGRDVSRKSIEPHDEVVGRVGAILDFADVHGQDDLVDAVTLAAAGGHNMLMIGEPGCGKTMVAQRIPGILPQMNESEMLEVTKIHSIAGLMATNGSLLTQRPFRAPHHNASLNALIGGGVNALPGEVSLAHNGVLFLDELGEFPRRILDALRQPIEDKKVTISRVSGTNTYPSAFMFVAAMNPCPCGYYPGKRCKCSDYEVVKYRSKISGPILDRIDIQKSVRAISYFEINNKDKTRSSEDIRLSVSNARKIQQERYSECEEVNCNAQMSVEQIKRFCSLDTACRQMLKDACGEFGYSARVVHKLLRLARTSADLREASDIGEDDVSAVLSCRDFDKGTSQLLVVS